MKIESRARARRLFIDANERVLREICRADDVGEPSDSTIAEFRAAAASEFDDAGNAPLDWMESMQDEAVAAAYADAVRPRFMGILAPLRPS